MKPKAEAFARAQFAPMGPGDVAGAAAIEAGVADGWSAAGIAGALAAPAAS